MDLVIGMGQIGEAVSEVIGRLYHHECQDKDIKSHADTSINIMHICFGYSDDFIEEVKEYQEFYMPDYTVIWSTVPIGTTKQIQGAVHSPVEGRHPDLAESIKRMPRWIGSEDDDTGRFVAYYFRQLGLKTSWVKDSRYTEFLKLRSTSKYGINLVWADYEKQVANELGMNFSLIKQFDRDYNALYQELGMDWAQRYILDAPEGKIGGHCVVPNAELLDKQYPSELLKMVKEMK